jgi:hypothetical protein
VTARAATRPAGGALGLAAALTASAGPITPPAAPNADAINHHAWFENLGWASARAPDGAWGLTATRTHLRGWCWGENIGWLSFGAGPSDGLAYTNIAAPDVGVNIDPASAHLDGWAWGENVGWVRFGLPSLDASQRPRLVADGASGSVRLRGYAWGENTGWLSFEGTAQGAFVAFPRSAVACGPADIADTAGTPVPVWGGDGALDNGDFQAFFSAFFAADCPGCHAAGPKPCNTADIADTAGSTGPDGCVDNGDFSLFFTEFFGGCP